MEVMPNALHTGDRVEGCGLWGGYGVGTVRSILHDMVGFGGREDVRVCVKFDSEDVLRYLEPSQVCKVQS